MKRMRRWMFNGLLSLSLLLCLATAVAWVRSYIIVDEWTWITSRVTIHHVTVHHYKLMPMSGSLHFIRQRLDSSDPVFIQRIQADPFDGFDHSTNYNWPESFWYQFRFKYEKRHARDYLGDTTWELLGVPAWMVVVSFGLGPAAWLATFRRRRRLEKGFCLHCGYDIRATPDRCPECGTIPDKPPKSAT